METITEYQQQLMQAFGFDAADLEANKQGRFTDRQLQSLAERCSNRKIAWEISILVAFSLLGAALLMLIASLDLGSSVGVVILTIVIISGTLTYNLRRQYTWLADDVKALRVTYARGPLQLRYGKRGEPIFNIVVRGVRFPITYRQYKVFWPDESHCFYYLERSKTVLSVEYMPTDNELQ